MSPIKSNLAIMTFLNQYVYGHVEAKKALIVMLNRARLRTYQKFGKGMENEYLIKPLKVLLLGASGTGKTHLIDSLSKIGCIPIVRIDATTLNPTGADGGIKSDKLGRLINSEAESACIAYPAIYPYLEYAIEQTIVYVDEIDKLGTQFGSGNGNWNKHVQSSFLTMFDNKEEYAGVSFVFSGAFTEITGNVITPKHKNLGFTYNNEVVETSEILEEQIIKCGIIPELLGRISSIIKLDAFTEKDYIKIIKERLLPKKEMDLAAFGIFNHKMPKNTIIEIAQKAQKSSQGIRYAQREIDKYFLGEEYKMCEVSYLTKDVE